MIIKKAQFTCKRCKAEFEKEISECSEVWENCPDIAGFGWVKGWNTRCPKCRKKNYTEIVHKYEMED